LSDIIEDDAPEVKAKGHRGNFFNIDRKSWAALCDLQDINMAVAYLVIAQGTSKDNRISRWSANSIETYTGLHSSRAKKAIHGLVERNFLAYAKYNKRTVPRYEILTKRSRDAERHDLIWLPNALVQGTKEGETSPIRRLRSRGDVWALRLLIDLYQAQNLSADGGISRDVLSNDYERKHLGKRGRHNIWGFQIHRSLYNSRRESGRRPSSSRPKL